MQSIAVENYGVLNIEHVVLDYNGTLAKDGVLKSSLHKLLPLLSLSFQVHVITADTFGSVKKELEDFDVKIKVLQSENHTFEKGEFTQSLGSSVTLSVGNGNNDTQMLKHAVVGIALLGDEGCATATLLESDIVCKSIEEALGLLLNPKRLIATLRR